MSRSGNLLPICAVLLMLATPLEAIAWRPWGKSHRTRGSGDLTTILRQVAAFDRIEINAAFDLQITIGEKSELELTFDDNLIDRVITKVKGGTLMLDIDGPVKVKHPCQVRITIPELERITTSGAANIDIEGLDGELFEYNLLGAGNLTAAGRVDVLEVTLSGAGDVDLRHLIADRVKVDVNGAGTVKVHAESRLRARVSGVGKIIYYGDPDRVSRSVTGLGKLVHR